MAMGVRAEVVQPFVDGCDEWLGHPRGGTTVSHETQRELGQSTGHLFATNDLPYL